jgi:hypothetical protein
MKYSGYSSLIPSHTSSKNMNFTKAEMQTELKSFLFDFAKSIGRIYGSNRGGALLGFPGRGVHDIELSEAHIEDTDLWRVVNDMYDFGISGILISSRPDLGFEQQLDGEFCDAELFLRGLGSLDLYLEEDEAKIPRLAILTVRTAIARHVLEGGYRYTGYDDGMGSYLSFEEMALLANMDERSVRNAANPKLPNPLTTTQLGKRTFVDHETARRWLADRKGFVPTQTRTDATAALASPQMVPVMVKLPVDTMTRLTAKAKASGLSLSSVIEQLLA